MSDDWNLHDAVEDGIRDNAGHLALAGALMAHSQRKQQLQSLEASRRHQAEIARTEAERLEVERQRLEIEKLRHQIEKDEKEAARLEKEAVRLLRVMMAEVGLSLDSFMSRGELKGSPQGARRNYVMAVLMSKLALVRSRSGSLSDLNDLKELARLEELSEDLVAKHFLAGDPLEAARDKWRELQFWMDGVERLEKEVKQACAVVPDPTAVQLPSQADLVAIQAKLEAFAAQLASKLSEHVHCLPAETAVDGVVLSELTEQAQLEDLAAGKQANRSKAFASRWRQAATTRIAKEPGVLVTHEMQAGLLQEVQSAIEKLQQWHIKAVDHERTLQDLKVQLEEGQLKEAEVSAKKLGGMRFAGLNYQAVSEWKKLDGLCEALAAAKRGAASRLATDIRKTYPKAANQSELGRLLGKHEKRASGEKRRAIFTLIMVICLVAGAFKVGYDNHLEHQRMAAEAKAKAEEEQKQRVRMAAEAKAKAEEEQKQRERMAAEAKAKAEEERKQRERMAAEAKAKAEEEQKQRSREWISGAVGSIVELPLSTNSKQAFCFVPAGSFTMGSPESDNSRGFDEDQVKVTLSKPFWLAKTEVTQAQWEAVMGINPSEFKGSNLPVENVSWEDAQAFIAKLNERQILPQGWKFSLPSEAQWEYACRAGQRGSYSGGSLDEVGWYDDNSRSRTHEVGQKKPNAWGLYDMHGNVYEWCSDWYGDTLKGGSDPAGPITSDVRVFRGGSWNLSASDCRAAARVGFDPSYRYYILGFRPAIVLTK